MQPHATAKRESESAAGAGLRESLRWGRTGRLAWAAIQLGLLAYGVCTMAYLAARITQGERSSWVAFANNFVAWWALGGLLAGGVALLSRRRMLLVGVQLPIVIAFALLYGNRYLPRSTSAPAAEGIPLRVATFNTYSVDSDPERIVQVITAMNPDIIGLEELDEDLIDRLGADLSKTYPYQQITMSPLRPDVGLLSRYPILNYTTTKGRHGRARQAQFEVQVDRTLITIVVEHMDGPANLSDPLRYDDSRRHAQIVTLEATLPHFAEPVLVLCDCNMSDQSDDYRKLDRLLSDTFREAGWGLGLTFPAHTNWLAAAPRLLRLDYIWHSDHFAATSAKVWGDNGTSDHHPVVADLRLEPAPPAG